MSKFETGVKPESTESREGRPSKEKSVQHPLAASGELKLKEAQDEARRIAAGFRSLMEMTGNETPREVVEALARSGKATRERISTLKSYLELEQKRLGDAMGETDEADKLKEIGEARKMNYELITRLEEALQESNAGVISAMLEESLQESDVLGQDKIRQLSARQTELVAQIQELSGKSPEDLIAEKAQTASSGLVGRFKNWLRKLAAPDEDPRVKGLLDEWNDLNGRINSARQRRPSRVRRAKKDADETATLERKIAGPAAAPEEQERQARESWTPPVIVEGESQTSKQKGGPEEGWWRAKRIKELDELLDEGNFAALAGMSEKERNALYQEQRELIAREAADLRARRASHEARATVELPSSELVEVDEEEEKSGVRRKPKLKGTPPPLSEDKLAKVREAKARAAAEKKGPELEDEFLALEDELKALKKQEQTEETLKRIGEIDARLEQIKTEIKEVSVAYHPRTRTPLENMAAQIEAKKREKAEAEAKARRAAEKATGIEDAGLAAMAASIEAKRKKAKPQPARKQVEGAIEDQGLAALAEQADLKRAEAEQARQAEAARQEAERAEFERMAKQADKEHRERMRLEAERKAEEERIAREAQEAFEARKKQEAEAQERKEQEAFMERVRWSVGLLKDQAAQLSSEILAAQGVFATAEDRAQNRDAWSKATQEQRDLASAYVFKAAEYQAALNGGDKKAQAKAEKELHAMEKDLGLFRSPYFQPSGHAGGPVIETGARAAQGQVAERISGVSRREAARGKARTYRTPDEAIPATRLEEEAKPQAAEDVDVDLDEINKAIEEAQDTDTVLTEPAPLPKKGKINIAERLGKKKKSAEETEAELAEVVSKIKSENQIAVPADVARREALQQEFLALSSANMPLKKALGILRMSDSGGLKNNMVTAMAKYVEAKATGADQSVIDKLQAWALGIAKDDGVESNAAVQAILLGKERKGTRILPGTSRAGAGRNAATRVRGPAF